MYKGYGVHHVAVGVKNLETTRSFYRDVLEFKNVFANFPEAEYPALQEVVRTPHPVYAAILFNQAAGGIIVELVQMVNPVPRPIRNEFRLSDIGVVKITIAVKEVERLYEELKRSVNFCSRPKSAVIPGWGEYDFIYCRDPEGNFIEFVSGAKVPTQNRFGGVRWVGISVTDFDRSLAFFQKYLGFDTLFINPHETFSGLVDEVSGGKHTKIRSCVLACSKAEGMVELFEVLEPRGRSIPFGTRWGDFGYLQVCLNGKQGDDIFEIAAYFEKEGMEFLSGPQLMHDERKGAFFYMKDPDGIPVEFLVFLK
jgi:catechol 2,3-dioxygenase-like lactoylglutathione lyase family enzyme